MLPKLKPKKFTEEQLAAIRTESAKQTTENVTPKSTDPENFPVFDIPINDKVLIYVPNHTVVGEDGVETLRMDKPLFHTVLDGKRFLKFRCTSGLTEAAGYSGGCPLCDGESDPWSLANEQIKEALKQRNLDINDTENDSVKSVKRDFYSKRVIKSADRYLTYPVVVIETDPANRKDILFDENGIPKHKTYWYTISESAYLKKWAKTLEGMEDEPTHPGGYCFILNYTYDSKSGEYNKRDSARELQVVAKSLKNFADVAAQFDKETEEWTEIKAQQTVIDNMYYEEEDLQAIADQVLAPTREKLALYEAIAMGAGAAPEGLQIGEKLEPQAVEQDVAGALPMAGATDED